MKHIGFSDRIGAALLTALDVDAGDSFATLALVTQSQFEQDLQGWTWKSDDGLVDVKAKSKHYGQAGLLLRYARLLSGAEQLPAPATPPLSTAAPFVAPVASQPPPP